MKHGQFSQEQIVAILHEAEKGEKTIRDLCREHNITETTFYRWCKAYGGITRSAGTRSPKRSGSKNWRRRTPASNACWPNATWRSMPCRRI
jgi:transposase-like protein